MKLSSLTAPSQARPRTFAVFAALVCLGLFASFSLTAATGTADAKRPKRVVALTPFSANAMMQLRVTPKAVGQVLADNNSSYVPTIDAKIGRGIKQLTLSHPNGPNLEQLAKLKPDLVFTSPQWAKGTSAMRQLGIRVVSAEPTKFGQVYPATKKIARILGKKRQGNRLVKSMRRNVAGALRGVNSKAHSRVMVVLGVGRTPFTFLKNSWGGSIVSKAGGQLLTGGVPGNDGFARISDEVVIAQNPDIIIAVPHATKGDLQALIDYMKTNPAWQGTNALRDNQLYVSTDNSLLQAGNKSGIDPSWVLNNIRRTYLKNR